MVLLNPNFDMHFFWFGVKILSLSLKIQALCKIIPRQIKAEKAVTVIRTTVEELIEKCKQIVESEGEKISEEEYVNEADPSILRFLLASREEVKTPDFLLPHKILWSILYISNSHILSEMILVY